MVRKIKKINLFLLFVLLIITTSCSHTSFSDAYAIVYLGKDAYLLNSKNETFALNKYDGIGTTFGDLISVYVNKGDTPVYGYINRSGKEVIKPQYDMAYPFSDGMAVVVKKGTYKIINEKNKTLYTFDNDFKSYSCFTEGFLKIETPNGFTFMDKHFNICDKTFYSVSEFSESKALVLNVVDSKYVYNFLDTSFNLIFTNELESYDYVESYHSGLAKVGYYKGDNYLYSYIKTDGSVLVDENGNSEFEVARTFHDGKAIVFTGQIYYSWYSSTDIWIADYYSYQYLNSDGTYYDYDYKPYRNESKDDIDQWGHFGDFCGNITTIKTFSTGAGKWNLFQDDIDEDGNHYLKQLKFYTLDETVSLMDKQYYEIPYDITTIKKTNYYGDGTILLIVKTSTNYLGIVNQNGEYITKAIYDNVII